MTSTEAIELLLHAGECAASLAGYRCVTERSPSSESVYLHVWRRGSWHGLRLSTHRPAYACSKDYEQLIVPDGLTTDAVRRLAINVAARVRFGGSIVANPLHVRRAIRSRLALLDEGRRYVDRNSNVWVWSSADSGWKLQIKRTFNNAPPPTHRPRPLVNNRLRSAIRHDHNLLATWEQEFSREAAT